MVFFNNIFKVKKNEPVKLSVRQHSLGSYNILIQQIAGWNNG
jgi:hypothetical protein